LKRADLRFDEHLIVKVSERLRAISVMFAEYFRTVALFSVVQ
jgi:hypothetical protein